MAYAQKTDGVWRELAGGDVNYFLSVDGEPQEFVASHATIKLWSNEERSDIGIATIVDDETPTPEGKQRGSFEIVDFAGVPTRVWDFVDLPPAPMPDMVTNSDWRVALIMMGRFSDVEAAVTAARDSGTPEGLIAWQRWEYANHVYREQLLQMAPAFGFSTQEVDASLIAASQIS